MDNKGQSIIELIVAVSILAIISASAVVVVIHSFSTGRLAEEETRATLLAVEGLEAVQSIRNQGWDNLVDGTYGLNKNNNQWELVGTPDSQGDFTRQITIESVNRDGNGDIVQSGGTADDQTKKVVSLVEWDFTPVRQNQVEMSQYLTNWQKVTSTGTSQSQPTNCSEYCQQNFDLAGSCVRSNQCNGQDEGQLYECSLPNICCCQ